MSNIDSITTNILDSNIITVTNLNVKYIDTNK